MNGISKKYKIQEASQKTGLSRDTLRYYEKIGLLQNIERDYNGNRLYTEKDLSNLAFIQRAQKMDFRLSEIARLLEFRKAPQRAKEEVRLLAQNKLKEAESRLEEIRHLRDELRLLLQLCQSAGEDCPILDNLSEIRY